MPREHDRNAWRISLRLSARQYAFQFQGHYGEQFKAAVKTSKNYEDVGVWLLANGTAKTPVEIKTWSDEVEADSMMKVPEKRAFFIEECSKLGLNPQMNSTFDWLEGPTTARVFAAHPWHEENRVMRGHSNICSDYLFVVLHVPDASAERHLDFGQSRRSR
ncbi:MAG: DUF5069 domain-containing protein [Limisphaerales bacterium]